MYKGSNCDQKAQLSEILTEPLNPRPELKTLEWINFNPDFLIRISTVETFHFSP